MKNLFIINEEEKNRILNLHESATKRHYLEEAKVTGNDFGRKIQFDNNDSEFTKEIYGLLVSILKDGSVGSAIFNVDETALVKAISKIPDLGTLTKVSNELKTIMTQIGRPEYAGLDQIFNQVLNYGSGDTDEVESLITHLSKLGLSKEQTETLKMGKFVLQPVNVGNPAAAQAKTKEGQKTVVGKQRTIPTSIDQLSKQGYYLKLNDKNDLVKTIQTKLIDAGEEVAATGLFDQSTKNAVISFQTKNKLKPDGIVGVRTWSILSKSKMDNMKPKEVTSLNTTTEPEIKTPTTGTNQPVTGQKNYKDEIDNDFMN